MNKIVAKDRDCNCCAPFLQGWCKYVETPTGQMLDEKCLKVAAFVDNVAQECEKYERARTK